MVANLDVVFYRYEIHRICGSGIVGACNRTCVVYAQCGITVSFPGFLVWTDLLTMQK